MATRQLFNAKTQQVEDAEFTVDANNEIVATFADGGFIKFAAGLTADEFEQAIELHEKHNTGQIVITPEMEAAAAAERAASFALIGETDPTTADVTGKASIVPPEAETPAEDAGEPGEEAAPTDTSTAEPPAPTNSTQIDVKTEEEAPSDIQQEQAAPTDAAS